LCELSPICNRQLLKQCRMDGDRWSPFFSSCFDNKC
jgi:hypothetical protein